MVSGSKDFWPYLLRTVDARLAADEHVQPRCATVLAMVKHPCPSTRDCVEAAPAATSGTDRDVLARGKCLQALAALRHTKWFQVCVSPSKQNNKISKIRIKQVKANLSKLCTRNGKSMALNGIHTTILLYSQPISACPSVVPSFYTYIFITIVIYIIF